jgi:hypothetical protein
LLFQFQHSFFSYSTTTWHAYNVALSTNTRISRTVLLRVSYGKKCFHFFFVFIQRLHSLAVSWQLHRTKPACVRSRASIFSSSYFLQFSSTNKRVGLRANIMQQRKLKLFESARVASSRMASARVRGSRVVPPTKILCFRTVQKRVVQPVSCASLPTCERDFRAGAALEPSTCRFVSRRKTEGRSGAKLRGTDPRTLTNNRILKHVETHSSFADFEKHFWFATAGSNKHGNLRNLRTFVGMCPPTHTLELRRFFTKQKATKTESFVSGSKKVFADDFAAAGWRSSDLRAETGVDGGAQTGWNRLKLVETSWNRLKPVETSWGQFSWSALASSWSRRWWCWCCCCCTEREKRIQTTMGSAKKRWLHLNSLRSTIRFTALWNI